MRTLLIWLFGCLLGLAAVAQTVQNPPNGVPYTTNGFLAVIDFDRDGRDDSSYVLGIIAGGTTVVVTGFESDEFTSYLASKLGKAGFMEGERIASTNKTLVTSSGDSGVTPDPYQWGKSFFSGVPVYNYTRFPGGEFSTLTNALVGVRFFGGDNFYHHAWIRLTRPDNLPGTPFMVDSYDHNPLPDEPIGAGLPPPVPPITFTVTTDGVLLLTWAEKAVPYYKLQSRSDLYDPVMEWTEVVTGEEHIFTAPLDGDQTYYRLTRR